MIVPALTDIEQVLRWLVVAAGIVTVVMTILVFVRFGNMQVRHRGMSIFVSIFALGISLNYVVGTPVVLPGAFFYLVAYGYVICVLGAQMAGQPEPSPHPLHVSGVVLGWVVLAAVVVAILSAVVITNTRRIARAQHQAELHRVQDSAELHEAAVMQCRRVQNLREELNSSNAAGFIVIDAALAVIRSVPPPVKTSEMRAHIRRMKQAQRQLRFYPPTDCRRAVSDPRYERPLPISLGAFSRARVDEILHSDR